MVKPNLRLFVFLIHWGWTARHGIYGAERRFLEISKCFKDLGMEVYALEDEPLLKDRWHYAGYRALKVPLRVTRETHIFKRLLTFLYLGLTGLRLCRRLNCDLIYINVRDRENAIPAYFVSRLSRKPLAIVFHLIFHNETHSLSELLVDRRRRGFSIASATISTGLDFLVRFICRRAEVSVAVSRATAEDIIKYLGVKRCVVVGNGINISQFEPRDLSEKFCDAAFLGRLTPVKGQKGVDTLLKAWKIVASKLPSASLLIIGGGRERDLKVYENMKKELGIEHNVTMTGFIPDEQVVRLLNSSRIFVAPSRDEGFCLSVAEAMACGLPCIISDIPALREVWREGAIFVKPDDDEGFAKAILHLLRDHKKREALGRQAREYVKKFGWEEVARREFEVFKRICYGQRLPILG